MERESEGTRRLRQTKDDGSDIGRQPCCQKSVDAPETKDLPGAENGGTAEAEKGGKGGSNHSTTRNRVTTGHMG